VSAGKHPAPFSEPIIDALRVLLPAEVSEDTIVHDPFAGEGLRLGRLCDELGYAFSGADLEHWQGSDSRVVQADSTRPSSYPEKPFVVVTSPTYNNGVNDHFQPSDSSRRLTYRVAAGHALHTNNTGRYSGRGSVKGELAYWKITRRCIRWWPDLAIVNVKDSIRSGQVYPLVDLWRTLLRGSGYGVKRYDVECPGWRYGENSDVRVDSEAILVAKR
jgi:hypothetical protein